MKKYLILVIFLLVIINIQAQEMTPDDIIRILKIMADKNIETDIIKWGNCVEQFEKIDDFCIYFLHSTDISDNNSVYIMKVYYSMKNYLLNNGYIFIEDLSREDLLIF